MENYNLELDSIGLDSLLYALTLATGSKGADITRLSPIILAAYQCKPGAIRSRRLLRLLFKRQG